MSSHNSKPSPLPSFQLPSLHASDFNLDYLPMAVDADSPSDDGSSTPRASAQQTVIARVSSLHLSPPPPGSLGSSFHQRGSFHWPSATTNDGSLASTVSQNGSIHHSTPRGSLRMTVLHHNAMQDGSRSVRSETQEQSLTYDPFDEMYARWRNSPTPGAMQFVTGSQYSYQQKNDGSIELVPVTALTPATNRRPELLLPWHQDYKSLILTPRGIDIDESVRTIDVFQHFGIAAINFRAYRTMSNATKVFVNFEHGPTMTEICNNFAALNPLPTQDVHAILTEYLLLHEPRCPEAEILHQRRALKVDRALDLPQACGDPGFETNWEAPPVIHDLPTGKPTSYINNPVAVPPQIQYWLSLAVLQPHLRTKVGNFTAVPDGRRLCPYFSTYIAQDDLVATINRLAVTASWALYNRVLLRVAALQARVEKWTSEDVEALRHYGLVVEGTNYTLWVMTLPNLPDDQSVTHYLRSPSEANKASSFSPFSPSSSSSASQNGTRRSQLSQLWSISDIAGVDPDAWTWSGCTLMMLHYGQFGSVQDIQSLMVWIDQVHGWGLGGHCEGVIGDLEVVVRQEEMSSDVGGVGVQVLL